MTIQFDVRFVLVIVNKGCINNYNAVSNYLVLQTTSQRSYSPVCIIVLMIFGETYSDRHII